MKNIYKIFSLGFMVFCFVFGMGASNVNAAITFGTNAITEDGALTITGAVGSPMGFATTATTGAITIGNASMTTGTTTIYGGNGADAISLFSGTGGEIDIGGDNYENTVFISTGAVTKTLVMGSVANASSITMFAGTAGITINSNAGGIIINSTANKGTATLVGATLVVAGVKAGSTCVATDTDVAPAVVGVSLTGTNLTITGTAGHVINWLCL
jgi:hypothetical protein